MMAEDWDLFAIVRSCQSATSTATRTTNPPTTSTVKEEEFEAFSFPSIVQPLTNEFQELNELFTSFNPTTNATTTSGGINPNSPDFTGCIRQQERSVLVAPTTPTSIWPHFVPEQPSTSRFHNKQKHVQIEPQVFQKQEYQVTKTSSTLVLPNAQPQTPRSRKRKSQQKKMVCHVTVDNLSSDLWAWRKYGQKPIKGSPYPRNYYRCSSSKGCSARKQVERSNAEPDMFIVTYTGDHSHPRPTHRNSLAGTTRIKSPAMQSSSYQPITTAYSSPSSSSPVTTSAEPPENDVAEEEGEPDPEMEMETDEDVEDEADAQPPNQETGFG